MWDAASFVLVMLAMLSASVGIVLCVYKKATAKQATAALLSALLFLSASLAIGNLLAGIGYLLFMLTVAFVTIRFGREKRAGK